MSLEQAIGRLGLCMFDFGGMWTSSFGRFHAPSAFDFLLYLALATAVGWFAAVMRQPVDESYCRCACKLAALLHRLVQKTAKVQCETLDNAEDAAAATAMTASAVGLLSFAEVDCRGDGRPADVSTLLPGSMQIAAMAAGFLRSMAQLLPAEAGTAARCHSALASQGAAASLRQLLAWLAEPVNAVALSSAVLAEALPALAALEASDGDACRQLAAEGGSPRVGTGGSGPETAAAAAHGGTLSPPSGPRDSRHESRQLGFWHGVSARMKISATKVG